MGTKPSSTTNHTGLSSKDQRGATDITELDYEELSLDYLIVRLISEELEALTGTTDGA